MLPPKLEELRVQLETRRSPLDDGSKELLAELRVLDRNKDFERIVLREPLLAASRTVGPADDHCKCCGRALR